MALFNPRGELPEEFEYVDLESVIGTEMISHRKERKETAPSRAQRLAYVGDLFYQMVRPYQKNNYLFEKRDKIYVFSTGYAQMRPCIDGYFLLSLVQDDRFVRVVLDKCTGTSYPAINSNDLADIKVAIPSNGQEDLYIAKVFRKLDHIISLHQRKLEMLKKVKKLMLEKMFPKNDAKVPEVRFSDFTDAWEQRHLGEIVERVTRKNENLESTLPLTISAQYGLIDQNEFFDKRIASKDVSGYFLIRRGEFAYNKSTSTDAPWGAIKCLERYENGVLSTLYIVFRIIDEKKLNSNYLAFYYDTDLWHRGVQAIAAEGARNHGLLNIAPVDFFETTLAIPQDIFEQQKIGLFFKQLDHLISLHQRKYFSIVMLNTIIQIIEIICLCCFSLFYGVDYNCELPIT